MSHRKLETRTLVETGLFVRSTITSARPRDGYQGGGREYTPSSGGGNFKQYYDNKNTLYVANLDSGVQELDVENYFKTFGPMRLASNIK